VRIVPPHPLVFLKILFNSSRIMTQIILLTDSRRRGRDYYFQQNHSEHDISIIMIPGGKIQLYNKILNVEYQNIAILFAGKCNLTEKVYCDRSTRMVCNDTKVEVVSI
jgi:hypothetical protein